MIGELNSKGVALKVFKKEIVYDGPYIQIWNHHFVSKTGKKGIWQVAKRKRSRNVVIVFALTQKNEVLLVKQFRIPHESMVIELPAGLTDKKGESYELAARRELLEETGYHAPEMIKIIEGPFNAGMTADKAVVYFAPDVEYKQRQKLDDSEEIEVIKIPLKKIVNFITYPPKGVLIDLKILGYIPILKKRALI